MDSPLNGARILLCVGGGIAAYKAAALTSTLVQRGAEVDVVLTEAAQHFVAPLTFAALTARPVFTSLWDAPERIPHIRLVREARVALVAPATADLLVKIAHGIADDLVTTALLAARIPIVVAPAMNAAMYEHPATRAALRALEERGVRIVEPESGFLAEREHGPGRLASEERLLAVLEAAIARARSWEGRRVVITAGPTREAFDPVRFVSNAATGATGIALAREASARGARVTLVLGPTTLQPPHGVETVRVTTAETMRDAALAAAADADLVIATAAVADWRPADVAAHKLKKGEDRELTVRLVRTPDVLSEIAARKGRTFVVGFAAETDDHEANAREKLRRKQLDAIVVNDVSGERGFGMQPNALSVLWGEHDRRDLGSGEKDVLAIRLLDALDDLMQVRR